MQIMAVEAEMRKGQIPLNVDRDLTRNATKAAFGPSGSIIDTNRTNRRAKQPGSSISARERANARSKDELMGVKFLILFFSGRNAA